MSRKSQLLFTTVFFFAALLLLPLRVGHPLNAAAANPAPSVPKALRSGACLSAAPPTCNDPIDKCAKPVKYLGANGNCACFACEYGKATQKNICTENPKDKQTLLAETLP